MKKSGLADSPFFTSPSPDIPRREGRETAFPTTERTEIRTVFRSEERPEKRSVHLPAKRRTKRYSFEFYEDQLLQLKKLKYEAEMSGETLALSALVREALDLYLQDKSGS